jgi:hypothetical protein
MKQRSLVVKGETQDQKRIEGGSRRRRRKSRELKIWFSKFFGPTWSTSYSECFGWTPTEVDLDHDKAKKTVAAQ